MPGAVKRKAPINLNTSPGRLAVALSRHQQGPASLSSASSRLHDGVNHYSNESLDDAHGYDPGFNQNPAQNIRPRQMTLSEGAAVMQASLPPQPYTSASAPPRQTYPLAGTATPSAIPLPRPDSPDSIMDESLYSSPRVIFSPRNHGPPSHHYPLTTKYNPFRTPNEHDGENIVDTPMTGATQSSYHGHDRVIQEPPTPASPVRDLQLQRSHSNSPAHHLLQALVPPKHENILTQMLSAIMPVLNNHNRLSFERIDQMEGLVKTLVGQVAETREEVKKIKDDNTANASRLADVLKGGYSAQRADYVDLGTRLQEVEKLLRDGVHARQQKNLEDRLDMISEALENISETMSTVKPPAPPEPEPETDVQDIPKIYTAARTPSYDLPELQDDERMRSPPLEPVIRVNSATSPIAFHYLDAEVEALPPLVMEIEDIGVSTDWFGYADVGTARTPSPEPEPMEIEGPIPEKIDAATSPSRDFYVDSGIKARTPEPSPFRRDIGVMTSPTRMIPDHCNCVDMGIDARSPEPSIQRFSIGLMTSPSPQRYAAGAPNERSTGEVTSVDTPVDESMLSENIVFSPERSYVPDSPFLRDDTRSPSAVTPGPRYTLTQRTDSMPGMVTPPMSSPTIDPKAFMKFTRKTSQPPAPLSYALSDHVDWNTPVREDSTSSPTSHDSELPPVEASSQDHDNENEIADVIGGLRSTSPIHAMSPYRSRSTSLIEEVQSSVKDEMELIETVQSLNSDSELHSSIEENYTQAQKIVQSSIDTFPESANIDPQREPYPDDISAANSPRALTPEALQVEPHDDPNRSTELNPGAIHPQNSKSPCDTSSHVHSTPPITPHREFEFSFERSTNQLDASLPHTPLPNDDLPLPDRQPSPVVEQGDGPYDLSIERPMTPVAHVLDNERPFSPCESVSSQEEGSELSVARLVTVSTSQSPEKLPTIPESAPYHVSSPLADERITNRPVIDLSTPSLPNTPNRSSTSQGDAPVFKIKVPVPITTSSIVRPSPSPISIPTTPPPVSNLVTAPSVPRPIDSPIPISSSRSSSPLSEPPSSDEATKGMDMDSDIEIIPVKRRKPEQTAVKTEVPPPKKKKILNIKAATLGSQSAAITRVRKRKLKPIDPDEEPPLKRARERSILASMAPNLVELENEKPVTVKRTPISTGKEKESVKSPKSSRKKAGSSSKGLNWPPILKGNNREWVECTPCESWYHYGCVGIRSNDSIVKKTFVCPPCQGHGGRGGCRSKSVIPVTTHRGQRFCARPDCANPRKEDEYFVDCIVGRAMKVEGGNGTRFIWLLRWDGYPIMESTWEEATSMDDSTTLIADFYEKAIQEGFFPNDDPDSTIILREAVEAGIADPVGL